MRPFLKTYISCVYITVTPRHPLLPTKPDSLHEISRCYCQFFVRSSGSLSHVSRSWRRGHHSRCQSPSQSIVCSDERNRTAGTPTSRSWSTRHTPDRTPDLWSPGL